MLNSLSNCFSFDFWPAAGFPNLGMRLSVFTSLPWRVLVGIRLYVEHALVMLSPLVETQEGCGCPASVRISGGVPFLRLPDLVDSISNESEAFEPPRSEV